VAGSPQPQVTLPRSKGASEIHVPALTNSVVALAFTGTADTQALPAGFTQGVLVRVATSEDCYLRWDSSATAATSADTLMIRGVEPQLVPRLATHVSAVRLATDGAMTITVYQ
jgi:hypothetical protein